MTFNKQILLGAVLGIGLGLLPAWFGAHSAPMVALLYVAHLASSVFIALLKMVMVPLIFTSIAVGVAQLSAHRQMHRVWRVTLLFYLFTSAVAVLLGILSMQLFHPAQGLELAMFRDAMAQHPHQQLGLPEFASQFLSGLFVNPVAAMANGNIIAVVMFALLVGTVLVQGGDRYRSLAQLLEELFALVMQLVSWIMLLAPVGIMALLIKLVASQELALFVSLGAFMAVVIAVTVFHGAVILPLLVYLLAGVTPLYLWQKSRYVLLTAFSTSSSSATLPLTLRCLEEDMHVSKDVTRFVAPVGAQLNMDGTALYEAAAALFIASLAGVELNTGQQLVVCLTAMVAAIGAPGIPSAGMVTMVMVLQSVGLPAEAIAILLPIDRLLDAFRTAVNVEGDICGSLVVEKFST